MEGAFTQHLRDVSLLVRSVYQGGWDSAGGFRVSSTTDHVDSTWDSGVFPTEVLARGYIHR